MIKPKESRPRKARSFLSLSSLFFFPRHVLMSGYFRPSGGDWDWRHPPPQQSHPLPQQPHPQFLNPNFLGQNPTNVNPNFPGQNPANVNIYPFQAPAFPPPQQPPPQPPQPPPPPRPQPLNPNFSHLNPADVIISLANQLGQSTPNYYPPQGSNFSLQNPSPTPPPVSSSVFRPPSFPHNPNQEADSAKFPNPAFRAQDPREILEMIDGAVQKIRDDLIAAGRYVSAWKVLQSALLMLKVDAQTCLALGLQMQQVPSLLRLVLTEGRVITQPEFTLLLFLITLGKFFVWLLRKC